MTKIKDNSKDKDEGHFIILNKLVRTGRKLKASDFEYPRISRLNAHLLDPSEHKEKDLLSHSSAVKRLKELVDAECLEEEIEDNSKIRKRKLYWITQFGFIRLLGLCHKKGFEDDIWNKVPNYLRPFSNELEDLQARFKKEQLFNVLTFVCKNFNIKKQEFTVPEIKKVKTSFRQFSSGKMVPWRSYLFELKVSQFQNEVTYRRWFHLVGTKRDEEVQYTRLRTFVKNLVYSTFFYELTMRCVRETEEFRNYRFSRATESITKYSRLDISFLPFYRQFVNDIISMYNDEYYYVNKISIFLKKKDKTKGGKYYQNNFEILMQQSTLY